MKTTTKHRSRKRSRRKLKRFVRQAGLVLSCCGAIFALWVVLVPFPTELLLPEAVTSTVIVDREGRMLREVLNDAQGRGRWVALGDISPHVVEATIHAEDKRFWDHPGLDPIAIARSMVYNVKRGRLVTGASTLTQQTVKRTMYPYSRRTVRLKLMEMVWAVRLELADSKEAILEQYLNRVPYGNQLFGVEAAARMYFGKPASQLSLGESAFLSGLPQAPTSLNPYRHFKRAKARQELILNAMHRRGVLSQVDYARAVRERLKIRPRRGEVKAPHFTERVRRQFHDRPNDRRPGVIETTLDQALQERVEGIVQTQILRVQHRGVSQGSVVVLDTQSGEVLAWVGSRDYDDVASLGANDGVVALRQPGSTLKPFVYGMYLEQGGTAADPILDEPRQFPEGTGVYVPMNFDHRFRGPTSLRDALGSSLNVPAVAIAAEVGAEALLTRLRKAGLTTLEEDATHYGLGLSLGDGEVRLLDLASSYAALGRLGRWKPVRTIKRVDGQPWTDEPLLSGETRIFDREVAWILLDILSDDEARMEGFGAAGPLALPYRVAAKTGTSTEFRDNWAVGVTPDYTVAVWVGNFDGSPMDRVSGITGAAPILRAVFQDLYPEASGPADVAWYAKPRAVQSHQVCPLSGQPVGADCPNSRTEFFHQGRRGASGPPGQGEHRAHGPKACEVHQRLAIDVRNGLRAGPECPADVTEHHLFYHVPPEWLEWAARQEVQPPPNGWSPACAPSEEPSSQLKEAQVSIVHPLPGDVFLLDPEGRAVDQQLALRARVDGQVDALTWFIDGQPVGRAGSPYTLYWSLEPGKHRVGVGQGRIEAEVVFEVE